MASFFVQKLARDASLSDFEIAVLRAVDVRSPEDVDSLLKTFPSLATKAFRVPVVSNAVFTQLSAAYVASAGAPGATHPPVAFGAEAPSGAAVTVGSVVGVPSRAAPAPSAPTLGALDLRPGPWPVRNQNPRGTCVAFGAAACVEQFQWVSGSPDLSEQFLYWAIKHHTPDPYPTTDGTWLEFARDALASHGICDEAHCPYVNALYPAGSNVGGPPPSLAASNSAQRHRVTTYQRRPANAAATLHRLLSSGRVVAVSLPVFADQSNPTGLTNWTSSVAWAYGRVLNPPPTATVVGGHCVCVTGFVPDHSEPNGGYFVFRNSWDVAWANLAPAAGVTHAPEQGYGVVSATYVDTFCWELLQL